MNKEKLTGGNMSSVYKENNMIYRTQGEWSPTIHRFLKHLEKLEFKSCPQFVGISKDNKEILTYVDGITISDYPSDKISKEEHRYGIIHLAKIMKEFHQASSSFLQKENDIWMLKYEGNLPIDVICHNDIAPYNMTFKDNFPYKMIDFDTCCPAPGIWDIVYALYRFIPITNMKIDKNYNLECIQLFFENYSMKCPTDFFSIMIERLEYLIKTINDKAKSGDEAFIKMLSDGHDKIYINEINIIKERYL